MGSSRLPRSPGHWALGPSCRCCHCPSGLSCPGDRRSPASPTPGQMVSLEVHIPHPQPQSSAEWFSQTAEDCGVPTGCQSCGSIKPQAQRGCQRFSFLDLQAIGHRRTSGDKLAHHGNQARPPARTMSCSTDPQVSFCLRIRELRARGLQFLNLPRTSLHLSL